MKQFLYIGTLLTALAANPAPYGDPQMLMRRQQQPQQPQQPPTQPAPPNPGNGDDATNRGYWGYPYYNYPYYNYPYYNNYPYYWGGYPYYYGPYGRSDAKNGDQPPAPPQGQTPQARF